MASRGRATGFTLIELLLSVAIMAMVIGVATYGFSLFTRHWDGRSWGFDSAIGSWQRLDLVTASLSDSIPWLVRGNKGELGYYFLGRDEGLTFVTDSPVFESHAAAVVRVVRERQPNGRWQLVYEEASLSRQRLRQADQRLPFDKRMVVLTDLPNLSFEYFGWSSVEDRDVQPPSWWPEYDGMQRYQSPLRVAMNIDGQRSFFDFPDRADSALQAVKAD